MLIGHRGYAHAAPENTLPSFKLAMAQGVDLVELDYQTTQDGVALVIHDRELDRTTDVRARWGRHRVKVILRTAEQIRRLDAGAWFASRFTGAKVPLLREALELIQQHSVALIERKAGSAVDCLRLLRRMDMINHVIVQSFDWKFLRLLHEQEPHQVLGALGPPELLSNGRKPLHPFKSLSTLCLDELHKTGARIAVWNRRVTKAAIQRVHDRGLKVWVYTVDSLRLAHHLLDAGVDGIITNNPAVIRKAFE